MKPQRQRAWPHRRRRSRTWRDAWLFCALLLACTPTASGPDGSLNPEVALELRGCATVRGESICVLPPPGPPTLCEGTKSAASGGMTEAPELWIDVPASTPLQLRVDDEAISPGATMSEGGGQRVRLPNAAASVRIVTGDRTLASVQLEAAPLEPAIVQRARHARTLPLDTPARTNIERELDATWSDLDISARSTALDILADLAMQQADPASQRKALHYTRLAFELAVERDEVARASCHARRGLFTALERLNDLEVARQWREKLASLERARGTTRSRNAYYEGLFAQKMGDLEAAASSYGHAIDHADRHGDTRFALAATQQLATIWASLGRNEDVASSLETLADDPDAISCREWLRLLNNRAWARLRLRELGRPAGDPIPDLETVALLAHVNAAATGETTADSVDDCRDPIILQHARLNLALATTAQGWTGFAELLERQLDGVDPPSPDFTGWQRTLHQRLALARRDRGELIELLMRQPTDGNADGGDLERVWLEHDLRGRAFEALGLHDDALLAYAEAEAALQRAVTRIDFDAGRDRLLLGRQHSAGRQVDLLVARGRLSEALCTARLARNRTNIVLDRTARIGSLSPDVQRAWLAALSDYEQVRRDIDRLHAQTWSLAAELRPAHEAAIAKLEARARDRAQQAFTLLHGAEAPNDCDALQTPHQGEVSLLYFPVGDDPAGAWMGFAFDREGILAHRIETLPADAREPTQSLSHALLEPFAEKLRRAESIRVLPTGELWSLPFAALPWRDDVLLAHAPIALGLDLVRAPQIPQPAREDARAIVVGDPRGDLPAAAREAQAVSSRLTALGWHVLALRGAEATAATLRDRLPEATLLHYAGHGRHGGGEGWSGALALGDDDALGVTDVLALPRVPDIVLLPACETAPPPDPTLGGGMTLARAFVLAGAELVIAASGKLDDGFAGDVSGALYESAAPDVARGPRALQQALLEARTRHPDAPWWHVHALVP